MAISYETVIDMIERTGRVILSHVQEVCERLFAEANAVDEAIEQYCKIDHLMECVISSETIIGNSDFFHNMAVVLARNDAFDYACEILELGLKRNPNSIDLLADYLNYGCYCNRHEKCETYFNTLYACQDSWNWRAYQFSIDYLLESENYGAKCDIEKINNLVVAFISKNPDKEISFLTKANWLRKMPAKERISLWGNETYESVLADVTNGKFEINRTPKCDLNLADYYYSLGTNFTEAYKLLERCKPNSAEIQPSVNRGYVYLLSSLCKMSIYYEKVTNFNSKKAENDPELELLAKDVYEQYHIAAQDVTDLYVYNCRHLIETFICESGIPYPYDDGIENKIN